MMFESVKLNLSLTQLIQVTLPFVTVKVEIHLT